MFGLVDRLQFAVSSRWPDIKNKLFSGDLTGTARARRYVRQLTNEGDFVLGAPNVGRSLSVAAGVEALELEEGRRYELVFGCESGADGVLVMPASDIIEEPKSGRLLRVYRAVGNPGKRELRVSLEVVPEAEAAELRPMVGVAPVVIGIIAVAAAVTAWLGGRAVVMALKEVREIVVSPTVILLLVGALVLVYQGKLSFGGARLG